MAKKLDHIIVVDVDICPLELSTGGSAARSARRRPFP
jgi:hypothetical protein